MNVFVLCVHQDFQLNRVVMEEGAGAEPSPAGARPKKKNRKAYDLTAADKFWQKHKGRSVLQEEGLEEDEGGLFLYSFLLALVQVLSIGSLSVFILPIANIFSTSRQVCFRC